MGRPDGINDGVFVDKKLVSEKDQMSEWVTFPAPEHQVRGLKRRETAECPLAGGGGCPAPTGVPSFVSERSHSSSSRDKASQPRAGTSAVGRAPRGADFALLVGGVFSSGRRQVAVPEVTSLRTSAPTVVLSCWPPSLICLTPAGQVGSARLAEGVGAALSTEGPVTRWLLAPLCLSIVPHVNQIELWIILGVSCLLVPDLVFCLVKSCWEAPPPPGLAGSSVHTMAAV